MVLEVDNVEHNYGNKFVLYGIYLKAKAGEITGILGRNGSGKTTLLNILFGQLKPKHVNVRVDGKNVKGPLFQTNQVAYLPQHQLLPNDLSLQQTFSLFNSVWSDFIERFPLFEKYKTEKFGQLSSGEKKIVETYLILVSPKPIILLDEPFSYVAPIYVQQLKQLVLEQKEDKIILLTDHLYEEIIDLSKTLYLIKGGCSKLIQSKNDLKNEGYLLNHKQGPQGDD